MKIGCYPVNVRPWVRRRPIVSTCLWAQGLCGGPDAPVANGGPPLSAQRLTFRTRLSAGSTACWDTVLIGRTLYIALPPHILPEGSRDAFVALLEAAEEKLNCQHVVVRTPETRSTSSGNIDIIINNILCVWILWSTMNWILVLLRVSSTCLYYWPRPWEKTNKFLEYYSN